MENALDWLAFLSESELSTARARTKACNIARRSTKRGWRKLTFLQFDSARVFQAPIVTSIEPGRTIYRAEDDHQDFLG
jgi:hypothetical protein